MKQFFLDMKISHKLILSSLAFLIPLVVLLYLLVAEKNLAINAAEKEVLGVTYLAPMRALVEQVPQHRGLSYGFLNGKTDLREKISRKKSGIDEAMGKVDVLDQQYGSILQTSSEWNMLKREWQSLESENLSLSAEESFSRHTEFIKNIVLMMQHVADHSHLMQDPGLDSLYLIDSVFLKLPLLTEHVGRLRGLGADIMARGQITEEQIIKLMRIDGGSETLVEELEVAMSAVVTANAGLSGLHSLSKEAITKLHQYERILEEGINAGQFRMGPQAYFDQGSEVISSFFRLYDEATPVLTGLLKERVKGLKGLRQNVLAGATMSIVLGLVIGFFTMRAIASPLSEMTRVVQRVAKGDLAVEIHTNSKDEIGMLGQGFFEMLGGLKAADAQKGQMAQVSAMVENSDANFIFADADYNITYMNPASDNELQRVAHLLPCAVNDIVGKNIDIFHKNPGAIRRILSDPKNLPHSGVIHLGDEVLELTAAAIFDHDKKRIGTMANWSIVTEQYRLKSSLKETTVSVASASEELATASREMQANAEHTTAQAQNVASISSQTDQNVQSVAAAAEEMSVTVKEISKNVHNANQITEQAVEMAESMNETITNLDASNNEIGNVVKVISMIAGQTNLLALNATIEAARAGDAGKGFAVVANEVKELAKGTSKATDEIRQQIVAIQSNTKGAIESIEKITEIIKENNSITTSIASAVEEQSMTTNEISLNMAEAAKETKQVVEELEEIISTSQNTASSAMNIGEASEELSRTAGNLSSMTEE